MDELRRLRRSPSTQERLDGDGCHVSRPGPDTLLLDYLHGSGRGRQSSGGRLLRKPDPGEAAAHPGQNRDVAQLLVGETLESLGGGSHLSVSEPEEAQNRLEVR